MAHILDKETKKFWKEFGKGTTSEISEAFDYAPSAAQSLLRIFYDEVFMIEMNAQGLWIEHHWQPEEKSSPLRTKFMRDKSLVWVGYNGLWMATDRQALAMGTLLAYNIPTPYKMAPAADLAVSGAPDGAA